MTSRNGKRGLSSEIVFAGLLCLMCFIPGCRRPEVARDTSEEGGGRPDDSSASGQPYFIPAYSGTLSLKPGEVKPVQPGVSGPMSVRVTVDAKDRVAFGLVRKSELSNYTSPKQIEAAMESLPCATGGTGNMSRSCELGDTDKDFLLVVADLRDAAKATIDLFDKKKSEANASYFNSAEVSIYAALPPKK